MNPDEFYSASRHLYFVDVRCPHELRCALEREHLVLFEATIKNDRLEFQAASKCNGLPCLFRLVFEAARSEFFGYSLQMQISWAHMPREHDDYHRKNAVSWFDLWCKGLTPCPPLQPHDVQSHLYQTKVGQTLIAEEHLTDIPAIQNEILTALRGGALFTTSHKEGGTRIGYAGGRFYRHDFGESSSHEAFEDEAAFLSFLRRFYDWETSKSLYPCKVSDDTAWRLIFRLLHRGHP